METTPTIEHLLQEGQEQMLARFSFQVLGEDYFPAQPRFKITEQPDHWEISVFAGQRGDKAGGKYTVQKNSLTVTDVIFYQ